MLVIFIVDSQGVCEARERLEHLEYRHEMFARETGRAYRWLSDKVQALEAQTAAVELALREIAEDPGSPTSAARRARNILALLEG